MSEALERAMKLAERHHADIDAGAWERLAARAESAGYDRRVVLRHRNSRAMTSTNIGAAYQQGWWDCIAFILKEADQ